MYLLYLLFYLLLYFSSKTFIDFIPNQNLKNKLNKGNNEQKINTIQTNNININKNYDKLENELINEKNKNKLLNEKIRQLEKELINEKNKNKLLNEKIKQLEKELINERNKVKQLDLSKIELQKSLELKNKEIEELKFKNNPLYNIKLGEQLLSINFTSIDQKIANYSRICKNTDIFVRIEEQLYKDFPEYKDKETYFMKNADKIKRFKSLDENNIKNNDVLVIYTYENEI